MPIKAKFMFTKLSYALALASGMAALLPVAADAQYYGRWGGGYGPYGYYDGGPYGGPPPYEPDDYGPVPGPRYREPPNDGPHGGAGSAASHPPTAKPPVEQGADLFPMDMIRKRISAAGYRLIAEPRHKGNIYLAEVEDKNAVRHRLVYDAHDGHLIENTALGAVKKMDIPPEESQAPRAVEPRPDHSSIEKEQSAAELVEQTGGLSSSSTQGESTPKSVPAAESLYSPEKHFHFTPGSTF